MMGIAASGVVGTRPLISWCDPVAGAQDLPETCSQNLARMGMWGTRDFWQDKRPGGRTGRLSRNGNPPSRWLSRNGNKASRQNMRRVPVPEVCGEGFCTRCAEEFLAMGGVWMERGTCRLLKAARGGLPPLSCLGTVITRLSSGPPH